MSDFGIKLWPDKAMTQLEVQDVTQFGGSLREFCDMLAEFMFTLDGAGISATQVGDNRNLFILDGRLIDGIQADYLAFANPRITNATEDMEVGVEGCLSFPGLKFNVMRHKGITIEAQSWTGDEIQLDCDGFLARAIQHEFDHLNHKYLIDYVGPVKRKLIIKKINRANKLKR